MKLSKELQSQLDRFTRSMASGTASPGIGNLLFDAAFEEFQTRDNCVTEDSLVREIFPRSQGNPITDPHHVGAFRSAPKIKLTRNNLADNAELKSWFALMDGVTTTAMNEALGKLEIPFTIAKREIRYAAYKPDDVECNDPSKAEVRYGDQELVFRSKDGVSLPIHSLGSGFGVILPVLVALVADRASFLSIEEPESHVHPKLQTELGDIIIESAAGNRKKTLLIETHSEHLILRLLRRIRETTEGNQVGADACSNSLCPEEIAVLYIQPGSKGSKIKELRINHLGEFIDDWPEGFFEERIKEVF